MGSTEESRSIRALLLYTRASEKVHLTMQTNIVITVALNVALSLLPMLAHNYCLISVRKSEEIYQEVL